VLNRKRYSKIRKQI